MGIPYKPTKLPDVQKLTLDVNNWQGINRIEGAIGNGEMKECYNMSSDNVPYTSPRKPREIVKSGIVNPQKIFDDETALGYIADGKFYYNDTLKGECGNTNSVFYYDNCIYAYPSNKKYDIANDTYSTQSTSIQVKVGSYTRSGSYDSGTNTVKTYKYSDGPYDYAATFCLDAGVNGAIDVSNIKKLCFNQTGLTSRYETYVSSYNNLVHSGAILLLTILDANGNNIYHSASEQYGTFYKKLKFGEVYDVPSNAKTVYAMVGYYSYYTYNQSASRADTIPRDNDYIKLSSSTARIWIVDTEYPAIGGVPTIDYATEFSNRVFAVQGNSIYATALGDFSDWTSMVDDNGNPKATGAFVTDVGSDGKFNGIVTYKNHVVCTKPDYVYEIYGTTPPFRVQEICKTGCIDGRSICEVNSILYWLGRNGIYAYTGGQPRVVSQKLNKQYISGVGGTDGRKYYCSIYDGTKWELCVYDTFNGLWHIEDFAEIKDFTFFEGHLYALTADGNMLKFNSGSEKVEWSFETQAYTLNMPQTKNVSKIYIRVEMDSNTMLDVYTKTDNNEYKLVASYQKDELTMFDVKIRLKKCDTFAFKFVGKGNVRIFDIHADVTLGTSKHRSGIDLQKFRG